MENKKSENKNGKKIAIIAIIAVLLAAAVILCVLLPKTSPANPDDSAAPTESADPASPDSSKPGSTKPDTKPNASASPEASAAPTESAAPTQPGNTGSTNTNTGSGSQTVPGQSGGSTGNQNSGTQTSGNTQSGNQNSDSTEHQHSWQPVYKTVHHDEKGHYETVVVQAAWDEEILRYTDVCNVCGYQGSNVADHIWDAHDGAGSYHNEGFPTGEYIHHDEVTEQRWVVDTPAYDEQVVAGYKCSCGQEKLA